MRTSVVRARIHIDYWLHVVFMVKIRLFRSIENKTKANRKKRNRKINVRQKKKKERKKSEPIIFHCLRIE